MSPLFENATASGQSEQSLGGRLGEWASGRGRNNQNGSIGIRPLERSPLCRRPPSRRQSTKEHGMQGPRSRGKGGRAKPAPSAQRRLVGDTFASDLENARGWNASVRMMCDRLDLPDLSTRDGLKKVHTNFAEIYCRLDEAYSTNRDNPEVLVGIVGIWAKLSVDVIPRGKMFDEEYNAPPRRVFHPPHRPSDSLGDQHQGGVIAKDGIAREAPRLIRTTEQFPNDPKVAELCIVTLMHSVGISMRKPDLKQPDIVLAFELPRLLRVTIDALRMPTATFYMMCHAMRLLSGAATRFKAECGASMSVRCAAVCTLFEVHCEVCEVEDETNQMFDLDSLTATLVAEWPANIAAATDKYGVQNCDSMKMLQNAAEFLQVMETYSQHQDPYVLGKVAACFITRSILVLKPCSSEPKKTPCSQCSEFLPRCINTYMMAGHRYMEAFTRAQAVIARNPNLAYAYYAIVLCLSPFPKNEMALRTAKKGLKCTQTTSFVRNYLQWVAVDRAGKLGISILEDQHASSAACAEGIAILTSAYEDAQAFIACAPPDSPYLGAVLNWLVILTLLIRGHDMAPDLQEFQATLDEIDLADQIRAFFGYPPKRMLPRVTRELIFDLYPAAVKEWGPTVARFNGTYGNADRQPINVSKAENDLAAWLAELHVGARSVGGDGAQHELRRALSLLLVQEFERGAQEVWSMRQHEHVCGLIEKDRSSDSDLQHIPTSPDERRSACGTTTPTNELTDEDHHKNLLVYHILLENAAASDHSQPVELPNESCGCSWY
ncbi:hypothetical protein OBBRIDRAFT_808497 [Obba rivulosa]|uniref:Uncharacterized protein n=1 Tax=Obba rivulosa TaxID=1052685 RepID=A0A8E2AGK8_9APHY|nr:hypothetical protein OBBRIDRAFT_808497 [Obba rivulosa]